MDSSRNSSSGEAGVTLTDGRDGTDARTAALRDNVETVRQRIADACQQAGRSPAEVRLVGVTKYVSAEDAARLLACGVVDLGESRPQSLWEKAALLEQQGGHPRWHMIGHLQRNKLRRTLPLLDLLHSLDSPRLAAAITAEAARLGRPCQALIEVNLTGDPGRSGVMIDEIESLAETSAAGGQITILGLMGMASIPAGTRDDANISRRQFASLREVRDRLRGLFGTADGRGELSMGRGELSMGMSGDFEEAILEGSTMVRIGSILWDGLC
jgi:pyridoxal phosphate enzyme (YggS family)